MLKKTLLAAVVLGLATTAVQANDVTGYLSGSLGQSDHDRFGSNTDLAYKIAVGLQANPYVALEAQYIDLGDATDKGFVSSMAAKATSETKGLGANLVGTLPLDDFKLFAKVGYHRLETKSKLTVGSEAGSRKAHDWVPSFGVGASYAFTPAIEVVAEYERYKDAGDRKVHTQNHVANFKHDIDLASVGLRYNF